MHAALRALLLPLGLCAACYGPSLEKAVEAAARRVASPGNASLVASAFMANCRKNWSPRDLQWYLQYNWQPGAPLGVDCWHTTRLGNFFDGGKKVCDVEKLLAPPCTVVSVGSNGDPSFENAVHQLAPHCKLYTFDGTLSDQKASVVPAYVTLVRKNFDSHSWKKFKDTHVNLLKMDCEGCELESLPTWLANVCTDQIVMETHGCLPTQVTNALGYAPSVDSDPKQAATRIHELFSHLEAEGFAVFDAQASLVSPHSLCFEHGLMRFRAKPGCPAPRVMHAGNPLRRASVLEEHGAIVLSEVAQPTAPKSSMDLKHLGKNSSSHRCVGNLKHPAGSPLPWLRNRRLRGACVFENVCYTPAPDRWSYFQPRDATVAPAELLEFGNYIPFSASGERIGTSDSIQDRLKMYVAPHEKRVLADSVDVHGLTALFGEHFHPNIGHYVWEHAFALLSTMAQLGVYEPELNVLRMSACPTFASVSSWSKKMCDEMSRTFVQPLTGRSPERQENGFILRLSDLLKRHSSKSRLCFDRLLVGGIFNAFDDASLNMGREGLFSLYRHRVLTWHGLDPSSPAPASSILLVRKTALRATGSRATRGISNFDEVEIAVRERFQHGHSAIVQVTDFASMTFAEQLKLLTRSGVAVSPCGGISMLLPFLPPGATVIIMNYVIRSLNPHYMGPHGECANCSWAMEGELWQHIRHIKKYFYTVTPADVPDTVPLTERAGEMGNKGEDGYHAQRNRDVHVDIPRLLAMIQAVIH